MGRDLSHPDAVSLLGAYALDALEDDERHAVERHARDCRPCSAEIADHREVAGLLTPGWVKPPPGLWARISAALEESPPPLDLAPVIAMKPEERRSGLAPSGPPRRRRAVATAAAAMVAAAAVAVIGVLGFRVADDSRRFARLAVGQHGDQLQRSVNAALADPRARQVALRSDDGLRAVDAVVLPDGTGYVVRHNLPALAPSRTYQLWALVGTSRISIGVLGAEPTVSSFKMAGDVLALAITEEVSGGVETTRKDPVVLGRIQTA